MIGLLTFSLITYLLPDPQVEEPPLDTGIVQKPCKDAIAYDWENARYICPEDTAHLKKNPMGRGWIPKDSIPFTRKVKLPRHKRDTQEEVESRLDDLEKRISEFD